MFVKRSGSNQGNLLVTYKNRESKEKIENKENQGVGSSNHNQQNVSALGFKRLYPVEPEENSILEFNSNHNNEELRSAPGNKRPRIDRSDRFSSETKPRPRSTEIREVNYYDRMANGDDSSDDESAQRLLQNYSFTKSYAKFNSNAVKTFVRWLGTSGLEDKIQDSFAVCSIGQMLLFSREVNNVYYKNQRPAILGNTQSEIHEFVDQINATFNRLVTRRAESSIRYIFKEHIACQGRMLGESEINGIIATMLPALELDIQLISLALIESNVIRRTEQLTLDDKKGPLLEVINQINDLAVSIVKSIVQLSTQEGLKIQKTAKFPVGTKLSQVLVDSFIAGFPDELASVIKAEVLSIPRKTLGDAYTFEDCQNTLDLMASFRIVKRSHTRLSKNLRFNSDLREVLDDKQVTVLIWQLLQGKVIDNLTVYTTSCSRTDLITSLRSYQIIKSAFAKKKQICINANPQFANEMDHIIATWVRGLINGQTTLDKIDNNPNLKREIKSELKNYFLKLGFLLLGSEVMRNPAVLLINQMVLDLIIAGKLTWERAFELMPMAVTDAVQASRTLQNTYRPYLLRNDAYYPGPEKATKQKVIDMLRQESEILRLWLDKIIAKPELPLTELIACIEERTPDWFGQKISLSSNQ